MSDNYEININVVEVAVTTEAIDLNLVKRISVARKLSEQEVIKMLTHNVFTVNQYAALIGKAYQTVNNMTRLKIKEGKELKARRELTICYPFSTRDEDGASQGPKFIHRNKNAMDRIERLLK